MTTWTDERILSIIDGMEKEFGDKVPNPTHHPIQYKHFILKFLYLNTQRERQKEKTNE